MPLSFPSSPSVDDTANGFRWDGEAWVLEPTTVTGPEGPVGPTGPPGPGVTWLDEWDDSTTYDVTNAVAHNGSSWVCAVSNTNSEPADGNFDWVLAAAKGDPGDPGDPGPQGDPGDPGADGADADPADVVPLVVAEIEPTVVLKAGDTMSGDLDLDGNTVKNLAAPADDGDALPIGASLGLYLPTASVSGGTLTGGAIRQGHSVNLAASYTQTAAPTEGAVLPGFKVSWDAILQDSTAFVGPTYGIGQDAGYTWGPPAVFELAGRLQYDVSASSLSFTPIGYANMLFCRNKPGTDKSLTPVWDWMHVGGIYADNGTITLNGNDADDHGATFLDWKVMATANSGTITGMANNVGWASFQSAPHCTGNVHIPYQYAFEVKDLNSYAHTPVYSDDYLTIPITGADSGTGVVDKRVGLLIPWLFGATVNVGIENGSATVESLKAATLSGVSSTIPITATAIALTNSSGGALTLTSSPPISTTNAQDGQRLTLLNVGSNSITVTAGTGLQLVGNTLTLAQGSAAVFVYSSTVGKWCELTQGSLLSKKVRVFKSTATGSYIDLDPDFVFGPAMFMRINGDSDDRVRLGALGLTFGDGASTPDTTISRSAAATFSFGNAKMTNARYVKRVSTQTSNANPTINTDNVEIHRITALAANVTSFTTNLSGTPTDGQILQVSITDNGTPRTLSWGSSFENGYQFALPTTTVASTRMDVAFQWNTVTLAWRCVGVA